MNEDSHLEEQYEDRFDVEDDVDWEGYDEFMSGGECPYCGLVMSRREKAEQGACNDCYGDRRP